MSIQSYVCIVTQTCITCILFSLFTCLEYKKAAQDRIEQDQQCDCDFYLSIYLEYGTHCIFYSSKLCLIVWCIIVVQCSVVYSSNTINYSSIISCSTIPYYTILGIQQYSSTPTHRKRMMMFSLTYIHTRYLLTYHPSNEYMTFISSRTPGGFCARTVDPLTFPFFWGPPMAMPRWK